MSADYSNFSLNGGKNGKVDLENFAGGLKREQIKDKNLLAIFDAIDDGNRVLDENEISNLKNMLKDYAKNTKLSNNEADKLLQNLFSKKQDVTVTKEDLYKFLNTVDTHAKGVKKSEVVEENGHNIIQTEYKDGTIEKFDQATKKRILIKDNKTSTYDEDDTLLSEEYFDRDGNSIKTSYENGKIKKSVKTLKNNAGKETTDYEDEKPKTKTVQNAEGSMVYAVTESGEKLIRKVENGSSSDDETTTVYEYDENGDVTETVSKGRSSSKSVKRGEMVLSSVNTERREDGTSVETITDENGNVTENILNENGKRIKQTKTVDGKTYTVEYDGEGNTKIIVQNGESISKISKIFGIDPDELTELNSEKVKEKNSKKYFLVGDEILIPKELEADDEALKNRKSSSDTIGDYNDDMAARQARRREQERKRQEEQKAQEALKNKKAISFTCGQKTFEEVARANLKADGITNPTQKQLQDRIAEIKKLNPNLKDGEIKGKRIVCKVQESTYNRVVKKQKEVAEINKNIKNNRTAKVIAENLYKVCDDNAAAIDKKAFWNEMNKVNKDNVVLVLDNYDKVIQKHTEDSSLIDTICSEVGASQANRKKALNHLFNSLAAAAKKAGVSDADIKQARKTFTESMNKEFSKIGRIDPKEMEKAVDFLRGATVGAKLGDEVGNVSTQEAMNKFVKGNEGQGNGLVDVDNEAQKTYKDAREAEGWVAKTGDWVCGLFGCTTIADMDKKLGKHAADVKKLAELADKKDEAGFKKMYKQVFGIEFNPKAIQARETAQENYQSAAMFDSAYKAFATLENKTKNKDFATVRNEIKQAFGYSDEAMDALIQSYGESKSLDTASNADKKYILDMFIRESKQTYLQEFHKLSKGKTLEQMANDVDLLTKSAYGTNDIVKDVLKFNENQQMTEMVTSAAFEIAGTIALQFVPGLGQLAAARLAISAAKWGAKGIKVVSMANKAYKAASAVKKIQTASKTAAVASQMLNAGVATAAVNLSDKKSVKDTMRKTLMNMSFAGVGATSSILAPKLMQSFGIVDRALANEIAEEIINMAGSYGVTKISGSDYGATDGFIDFASGLIMSRISHIKLHKTKPGEITPPKPIDDGGGTSSKPHSDSDTAGGLKPTPENPQKMTLLGEDVDVIKIETNKQGQKVLHTADGSKITLDAHDRPVIAKLPSDEIQTFEYANSTDVMPSKSVTKDKKNQITKIIEIKGDVQIEKKFDSGVEYILDKNGIVISERFLKLSEYPAGAKIPESDVYSSNMKKQIEECNSVDKLNELKQEYSMYNSQYGKTEDLFDMFQKKTTELEGGHIDKPQPHKPNSGLVTSTAFDEALKNLNLKKYGKKGIPLKYAHDDFMKDLEKTLNSLPTSERNAVMNDLNIKFQNDSNGKIELVDIPNISSKAKTESHQKVLDVLNKYAKQNEIQISDPALKAELEKFIKDVPEFSFLIGKPQNGVHSYSVDSHTLQNLQKALKYADDANLSDSSKEILKMSILLHDMGKQFKGETVSDTGHAILSKKYAEQILERFDYPQATKNKILNLIENHHWFKDFNTGKMSADDVMKMFGDDVELAKIMAKADLESVSDDFHLTKLEPGKKLSQSEYEAKIKQKMDEISPSLKPELIGQELPIGELQTYTDYLLDLSKVDKLKLGNIELDINDPALKKLFAELKDGESFAIGCTNPKAAYADVKYKIGKYEDGVGSHHIIITKKHGEIVINAHKPVSVIKDIPTKVNADPVIAKKIDELRKQASSITTKTFTVNGKSTPFEILNGTQGGSNKGYYVINKETGELFYAKESAGGNKLQAEMAAAQLYAAAGIDVPEISAFKSTDGTNGIMSKYIADLKPLKNSNALAAEGFGMDALLANWDVIGLNNDNLLITSDGKHVVRIDAGGSFDYHAKQGGSKPFGAIPTELITLLDNNVNAQSAGIFGKMSRADMINSLEKVANLKLSDITTILNNAGVPHYTETVLARRKFIKTFLEELKATPQGKESTLDYMRKTMGKALDKAISNAKTTGELEDIKNALSVINNSGVQVKLRNSIEQKKKILESLAPKVVSLSETQVKNLLAKNGFKESGGSYHKVLTDAEKQVLYNQYGSYSSTVISQITEPLSAADITKLQLMLNAANGKFINLYKNNMNVLIQLYRNIEHTNIFKYLDEMGTGEWETIANVAQYPPSASTIGAFVSYKGSGYQGINATLWKAYKANDPSIITSSSYKSTIDKLQAYISTQVINSPITVKRKEGYGKLMTGVTMPDGTTIDQAMQKAEAHYKSTGDRSLIDKIEDYINNSTKEIGIHAAGFMSASIAGPAPNISGDNVQITMNVQKGSKGALLECVNVGGGLKYETEILLQKDSKVIVTGIEYKNGHWDIKANVSN